MENLQIEHMNFCSMKKSNDVYVFSLVLVISQKQEILLSKKLSMILFSVLMLVVKLINIDVNH